MLVETAELGPDVAGDDGGVLVGVRADEVFPHGAGLLPERIEPFGAQDRVEHGGETHLHRLGLPGFVLATQQQPSVAGDEPGGDVVLPDVLDADPQQGVSRPRRGGQPVGVVLGAEQRLDARAHGYGS